MTEIRSLCVFRIVAGLFRWPLDKQTVSKEWHSYCQFEILEYDRCRVSACKWQKKMMETEVRGRMRKILHDLKIIYVLLTLAHQLLLGAAAGAAAEGQEMFKVRWVSQFSADDLNKETGFAKGLVKIIFGRKEQQLIRPVDVLVTGPDTFWLLDQGARTVSAIDVEPPTLRSLKARNYEQLPSLVGICEGNRDEIYVTDSALNKIFFKPAGSNSLQVLNPELVLSRPTGIAYIPATGEIWLTETTAHRLLTIDRNGRIIRTIGGRGTEEGQFNFPTSIWIDKQGYIYVVDSMNFRIQIFTETGEIVSVFGEPGDATGYLARPKGIATDSFGHIYVVDALFHTVQVFNRKGDFLYNFGRQGRGEGEFWLPAGISISSENGIYVADSYNARIQIFELQTGDSHEE